MPVNSVSATKEDTVSALAEVPQRIVAAWAAHDAVAFADVFTEDGSLILPGDIFLKSREAIRTFMAGAFSGPYKGTRVFGEPLLLKPLGDGVALVITQGGVIASGADNVAPDQEIRATWVLVEQDGDWRVTAYQNTPIRSVLSEFIRLIRIHQGTDMTGPQEVIGDLSADADEFDRLLEKLDDDQWAAPAPTPHWTAARQVAHLAAMFRMVAMAAADPAAFRTMALDPGCDFDASVQAALSGYLLEPPGALLPRWRKEHDSAAAALAKLPPDQLVAWPGGALVPLALAGAAMTELFVHRQDVADALRIRFEPTDRIRHVVEHGVRVWGRCLEAGNPAVPGHGIRLELMAPSGTLWAYGPQDSRQTISGRAEDFCLLMTNHRRPQELTLAADGEEATRWLMAEHACQALRC